MTAATKALPAGGWTDGWYWSGDGLRLHWRELPGPADRPVLLCIPGLTRTTADFDSKAPRHRRGRKAATAVKARISAPMGRMGPWAE